MAWIKMGGGYNGEAGGEAPVYWYNTENGEMSQYDPTPSGQFKSVADYSTEGQSNQMLVDAVTGRPATAEEIARHGEQERAKSDALIPSLAHLPPERQWELAQQIHQSMGIQAVARAAELGKFSPDFTAQLGPWIASRQAEASDRRLGGMSGVWRNPGEFFDAQGKGISDTFKNIDDRPLDPAGVWDSFRGDPETQPVDRMVLGSVADTGMRDFGRSVGRIFASMGTAAAMGGGTPAEGAAEGAGAAPSGATPSVADQYQQLAQANQATQADVMSGRMQVAQGPAPTMTDAGSPGLGAETGFRDPSWTGPADTGFGDLIPRPNFQLPSGEWAYGPSSTPTAPPPSKEAPTDPNAPADKGSGLPSLKDSLQTAAAGMAVASMLDGDDGSATSLSEDPEQQRLEEEQRQAAIAASTGRVNDAFAGFDDKYFSGIADAYRQYQTPIFQDQVANARRRLPMSTAHTQSSAFNRKAAELETDILRGEANLGRDALAEANRRRGEIDMTRTELLNLANSGADAENVASQAASKAALYSAPPQFSPIADAFEKFSQNALTFSLANRKQPQAQISRPLQFSHAPSSSVRYVA